jgi:hypothetical protein
VVNLENAVAQLGVLLEDHAKIDEYLTESRNNWSFKDLARFLTAFRAAVERLAPPGSAYLVHCENIISDDSHQAFQLERLAGVAQAVYDDYRAGALVSVKALIKAQVFGDFIEMAEHLLESGYKDPAAVLIGGVLEGELKTMAQRRGLKVATDDGRPLKAEALNSALAAAACYDKLEQKNVTAWLDLRNKAAHAEYGKYTFEHVQAMLLGVRHFVARMTASAV